MGPPARRRRWVCGAACALASCLSAESVHANGRYTRAQQLLVDPGTPDRMWLRATYGVLTSGDRGRTWQWICETALGISDGEDPALVVTSDGGVLVGGSTGLFRTDDHGCSFHPQGDISEYVVDLATYDGGASVIALTNVIEQSGASDLFLWRSTDGGRHFSKVGTAMSRDLFGMTLEAAASDSTRVYVTGVPASGPAPVDPTTPGTLLRSRDAGTTWERVTIAGTDYQNWPMIAAVHPTNPDGLYVRVRGASSLGTPIQSWLLYSTDAGTTFTEVFRGPAEMFGFSLFDGAATVLLGLGDSYDLSHQRPVDRSALGVYRASTSDFGFTRGLQGQVGCLTRDGSDLYVCSTHESLGFELGISRDLGATAKPVLDFGPNIGLPICDAAGSTAQICSDLWSYACRSLGACGDSADAGPVRAVAARGGCGCALAERQAWMPDSPTLGSAIALVFWSRRRRCRARQPSQRALS